LKHAQAFYGADAVVTAALDRAGRGRVEIHADPGDYVLLPSHGAVATEHVLFVGVESLVTFEYSQIREFTAQGLMIASRELPHARHVAMTIHGVNYGLDERETFLAQLGGVADAEQQCVAATHLTIIEKDVGRAARLKAILREARPEPRSAAGPPGALSSAWQITAGAASRAKPHVFVAMPFNKDSEDVYVFGIQGPVNEAGYLCERVDMAVFTGDIVERIKSRIATSSLVIADLTGANANVYLEVGYAWGKDRPTLLLCRQLEELRFDVRSQRCILYESIVDLARQLRANLASLQAEEETVARAK
jgi:hypothetical protein